MGSLIPGKLTRTKTLWKQSKTDGMLLLNILAMGVLGVITWQDLTRRAILWIVFPAGFVVFFMMGILKIEAREYLINILLNFLFVLILLTLSTVYFSIKKRKPVNVIDKYFGMGDFLFLVILCTVFSPVNFIIFLTGCFFLILLLYLIVAIFKHSDRQIPLAGLMAFFLIAVMVTDMLTGRINLLSNQAGYFLIENFMIRL
jgi:hypothetical protein